jgi:hypothetical protein
MKVVISREYGKNETKGILLVLHGSKLIYRCVSLELPDNGNQKNTSCIKEGSYQVVKYWTPTKKNCFYIQQVPGREDILIHVGNFAAGIKKDTEGCILVGSHFEDINQDGNIDISESTKTLKELFDILPELFTLHII